ncbi:MAG: lysophospholipid acyltransferase family protein [Gemmatimonadota bacterium]
MFATRAPAHLARPAGDRLAYSAWRMSSGFLSAVPPSGSRWLGSILGRMAFSVLRVRRATVESQLAASFPGRSDRWISRTARACYRHFGEEIVALATACRLSPEALLSRTRDAEQAIALLRRHRLARRGAVIVTGHLGNWELAGAFVAALGLPVTAVVRRHASRFDRHFVSLRRSLGVESVGMEHAAVLPRRLAQGGIVALVADQHAASRGVPVSFLGRPASTFLGPARLALTCGVPLYFGALIRQGAGYRALVARVEPPASATDAELELTRRWVGRLEEAVREHPEQYFWFHRRWKWASGERPFPAVGTRDGPARAAASGRDRGM